MRNLTNFRRLYASAECQPTIAVGAIATAAFGFVGSAGRGWRTNDRCVWHFGYFGRYCTEFDVVVTHG
jgi:hypothetical protein